MSWEGGREGEREGGRDEVREGEDRRREGERVKEKKSSQTYIM